jgi:hypothetical protein
MNIATKACFAGYAITTFFSMLFQDIMGKEAYIELAKTRWVEWYEPAQIGAYIVFGCIAVILLYSAVYDETRIKRE